MAKKKRSLHPTVRRHLEDALLEALQRHIGSHAGGTRKKRKAPARTKKAGKKKVGKKRPVRRKRRT